MDELKDGTGSFHAAKEVVVTLDISYIDLQSLTPSSLYDAHIFTLFYTVCIPFFRKPFNCIVLM